jgi:hypothetical protein
MKKNQHIAVSIVIVILMLLSRSNKLQAQDLTISNLVSKLGGGYKDNNKLTPPCLTIEFDLNNLDSNGMTVTVGMGAASGGIEVVSSVYKIGKSSSGYYVGIDKNVQRMIGNKVRVELSIQVSMVSTKYITAYVQNSGGQLSNKLSILNSYAH